MPKAKSNACPCGSACAQDDNRDQKNAAGGCGCGPACQCGAECNCGR